jgi:hypothetical protein
MWLNEKWGVEAKMNHQGQQYDEFNYCHIRIEKSIRMKWKTLKIDFVGLQFVSNI